MSDNLFRLLEESLIIIFALTVLYIDRRGKK